VNIDTNAVVGKHDGIIFYTYGQNKGLGLGGNDERFYVCGKDLDKNILYVADEKHKVKYLSSTSCVVEDFNWINGDPKKKTQKIKIRFRHRQELISGEYKIEKDKIIIKYKKTLSVTPGQFAVFYKKNTCLGGGIVAKIL
jgi:tRNA-specific 2-thiouridylase